MKRSFESERRTEAGMTAEQQRMCFELRMKLSASGFDWRAVYPNGEVVRFPTVSESGIRLLISDYSEATLTGIVDRGGHLTLVDECPATAAELAAIEAQRTAEEAAAIEARAEAARALERARKAAQRRARGAPTRAQWLRDHSAKPWMAAGKSRSAYYRAKKRDGMGGAGG